MPYLKHILILWLYSISIKTNKTSVFLNKIRKTIAKNFQSILKTDSKLIRFFHRFRLFLFPSKSIVFLTLVLSSGLSLFIIASYTVMLCPFFNYNLISRCFFHKSSQCNISSFRLIQLLTHCQHTMVMIIHFSL